MSNQSSRTEFVLSTDGKIIKRQITESEKELTAESLVSLTAQTVTHWPNVFQLPGISVSAGISKHTVTLTMPLKAIRIKTNYAIRDEVMVPVFELKNEPVFDILWNVPDDMRVFFVVELSSKNEFIAAHLPALDADKRCYRLPLGNLYDNGMICMGKEFNGQAVACERFIEAYDQFDKSQWNNDLQESADTAIIRKIFRFKPAGDGFTQLDATAKWQEILKVIAPPILNLIKI